MPRKTTVIDPEGNKVTTRTRQTNVFGPKGSSKVTTKFATPESFKKRKQVETYGAPKKEVDTSYKTGGMVNANAKIAAVKKATGIVGGTSKAPKKAVPQAKYGMTMKKGGMKKKSC